MRLNLFGLSGGKDSTALVGWALNESGYPVESLRFCFCDTQNEYPEVYQQIVDIDEYVRSKGCQPVKTLFAEGEWREKFINYPLFLALAMWKGRFPSARARFCTQFLKIKPTEKYIKQLISEGYEIVSHSGVRANESIERSLMQEWDMDMFGCRTRRPLLNLSISDIWNMHNKYGLPINPLYKEGWKRVGCRLCIMSNKEDVRRTVKKRPWVIDLYRIWEEHVGKSRKDRGKITDPSWFHRATVPLSQRSKLTQTKQGPMMVATIDDVARWSTTERGGVRQRYPKEQIYLFEEEDFNLDDAHSPCQSGYCE